MLNYNILALLTAAGRSHGIGGWAVLKWFSYVAFTLSIGYGTYLLYGIYFTPLALISAVGLASAHSRFFEMQGANLTTKTSWIETYFVLSWYKGDQSIPLYSWICMVMKGLLIGLPIFPFGLILVPLWPASYVVSFRYFNTSAIAEYLTGYYAGVALCLLTLLH